MTEDIEVKVIRDETGLAIDYKVEGDFPKYGNDDDRVDSIAVEVTKMFMKKLKDMNILQKNNLKQYKKLWRNPQLFAIYYLSSLKDFSTRARVCSIVRFSSL